MDFPSENSIFMANSGCYLKKIGKNQTESQNHHFLENNDLFDLFINQIPLLMKKPFEFIFWKHRRHSNIYKTLVFSKQNGEFHITL